VPLPPPRDDAPRDASVSNWGSAARARAAAAAAAATAAATAAASLASSASSPSPSSTSFRPAFISWGNANTRARDRDQGLKLAHFWLNLSRV